MCKRCCSGSDVYAQVVFYFIVKDDVYTLQVLFVLQSCYLYSTDIVYALEYYL